VKLGKVEAAAGTVDLHRIIMNIAEEKTPETPSHHLSPRHQSSTTKSYLECPVG
jgi:hypothetical protein